MTRRPEPGPGRPAAAVVVVAMVAVVVAVSLAPAPAPSAAQARSGPGSVTLVDQTTWIDPDGEIVVRFQLEGFPAGADVEATLHEPIADRGDFGLTLDRDQLRGRLTDPPIELGTVEELGAHDGGEVVARIPIRSGPQDPDGPERLPIFAAGVHPLDISIYDTERSRIGGFVTHVVRLPLDLDPTDDANHRVGLTMAVGLGAEPALAPDDTVVLDDATRSTWTAAATVLAATPDLPVVLAPSPELLASLAAGDSPLDQRLVDDLAAIAANGVVPARTYVDLDLDAMVGAGLNTEVDRQLDLGERALQAHLDVAAESRLWLGDDRLTRGDLAVLVERGIEQLIVPHAALDEPPEDPFLPFLLTAEDGTELTALATDPLLQDHLDRSDDARLGAQHLLADLALAWFDTDTDRLAFVMVDPDQLDPLFVETLSQGLSGSPLLTATTPDDAGAVPSPPVLDLARDRSDADLSQLRGDLDLVQLSIDTFTTVFPDSGDLTDRFDQLLSVVPFRGFDDDDRGAYYLTIAEEMESRLAGIGLPERRAITLPARDGTIPLTLTNDADRPAVVAVSFDSDRLDFPDGDRIEVTIPEGTRTVEIDVQVRTSGAFPLEIVVATPDGRTELASARYTIRSTAVSGVGIALSVTAIVILAVWWVRTARRARAAHRDDPPPEPPRRLQQ